MLATAQGAGSDEYTCRCMTVEVSEASLDVRMWQIRSSDLGDFPDAVVLSTRFLQCDRVDSDYSCNGRTQGVKNLRTWASDAIQSRGFKNKQCKMQCLVNPQDPDLLLEMILIYTFWLYMCICLQLTVSPMVPPFKWSSMWCQNWQINFQVGHEEIFMFDF